MTSRSLLELAVAVTSGAVALGARGVHDSPEPVAGEKPRTTRAEPAIVTTGTEPLSVELPHVVPSC
jgi:hypothetical protein